MDLTFTHVNIFSQFQNNVANTMIWLYNNYDSVLTVEGTTFENNELIEDSDYFNSGIITSEVGGVINVRSSQFLNNNLLNDDLQSGLRAVIYGVDFSAEGFESTIDVSDSSFLGNDGVTFALIVGGLWSDGVLTSSNNIQVNNEAAYPLDNECMGMARLIMDSTYYPDYYSYYYYHSDAECVVLFDTTDAPTKNPTSSPMPSTSPIARPPSLSCWNNKIPQKIMKAEMDVIDTSVTRTYRVCADTTIDVKEYDWDTSSYVGPGNPAVSIWNPNVRIICGDNGNVEDNCVFNGGSFQIDVVGADAINETLPILPLENISIEGFSFTAVSEANIIVFGTDVTDMTGVDIGASVLIKNCLFHVSEFIMFHHKIQA